MGTVIGIETEYGIYVEGKGAQDLVAEAAHLVRAVAPPFATSWDYGREAPRRDVRGFTVDNLSIDPYDAQYEQTASGRPHSTDVEVRSDRALPNGARLYNDHGHPEYSTPECGNLRDLVAHDRAGERVMQDCANRRMVKNGGALVAMYKNNTDFHGASYGTHESYQIRRDLPFDDLLRGILPFFVTRQLFAGAGKVGVEAQPGSPAPKGVSYQLSQRADYFTTLASVDTLYNRPIVNTRDEPHADARKYRRFHVICGDANMAEVATFLKTGTTLLVLRLLETGWFPADLDLRDPVAAIKHVSRDESLQWNVERLNGGTIGAVAIQRGYLAAVKQTLAGFSGETDIVIAEWETVLDRLESDPLGLSDTLDWAAKRSLLEQYRDVENLDWDDPALQSVDLEYHNVDPDAGLYYGLEQAGEIRRIVTDAEVVAAIANPPMSSPRAIVRGLAVRKFAGSIKSITWSRLTLSDNAGQSIILPVSAVADTNAAQLAAELAATETPAQFAAGVLRHAVAETSDAT